MTLQAQQAAFDDVKWFDSIKEGRDTCGNYEFCKECRKEQPNPCARAARRFANGYIRIAVIHRHS